MGGEGRLDRADHVVARVLTVQAHVVAEHRACPDIDDDQEPDALDLELLLEAQRVANDDLESKVEAMAVELDDVESLHRGGRTRLARLALQMRRAGQAGSATKAAQTFLAHGGGQRPNARLLDVEGIVSRTQAERPALAQEIAVQVLEAIQPNAEAIVRGQLIDGDALRADAVGEPLGQRRLRLQQLGKGAGGTWSAAVSTWGDICDALVAANPRVRHETSPTEYPAVVVQRQAPLQQTIEVSA